MMTKPEVLVTGVSTGIGQELTRQLIKGGYHVYGSVRRKEDVVKLKELFPQHFEILIFDVTDHQSVDQAMDHLKQMLSGRTLTALINNAGLAVGGPLLHIPIEDLRYQFEVNVIGLMYVTQRAAPLLGAVEEHVEKPGRIIMISSVSGKMGMPFIGPYCGSKFALEGLSQTLRRELLLYGIDVIVVGPGAIKTPIWEKSLGVAEKYLKTPYGKAIERFERKFIRGSVKTALEVGDFCERVVRILQHPKPRTRYTFVSKWLTNWLVPRMMPPRMVDRAIGRAIGLLKK